MLKQIMTIAGAALTATMLATAVPVQATGAEKMLKSCLEDAKKASDPKSARNHCVWRHWEKFASSN